MPRIVSNLDNLKAAAKKGARYSDGSAINRFQPPAKKADDRELMTSILVELRVLTELMHASSKSGTESIEALRAKFKDYPVAP